MNGNKNRKQRKLEQSIEFIQQNAFTGGENKLSRELTFQQAFSIHLRSQQLINEGLVKSKGITEYEKNKQIDHCWQQRQEQRLSTQQG